MKNLPEFFPFRHEPPLLTSPHSPITINNSMQDRCIHHWFEEQAQKTPHTVAVVFDYEKLTYQQLNQRANQLAHYLQRLGVKPETLVGIFMERSLEMVVALLAILKAGAAYVPIDPSYPPDRLAYMLADAQVYLLLTTGKLLKTDSEIAHLAQGYTVIDLDSEWDKISISQTSKDNPVSSVQLHNLAYVLYTSGSTGKPKGVMMEHLPLINLIDWHLHHRITPAKTLQFAPLSFDISFHEIFSTWCSGGTLVLISEEQRRNPEALFNVILTQEIEKIYLPFAALQQLAKIAKGRSLPLREIMTAGEQLVIVPVIAEFLQKSGCILHNHYGATECQDVTAFTLPKNVKDWQILPPIGRPIQNTQIYILDQSYQVVPIGDEGELYIGGQGIARGYFNRPDLTQERFIANPFGSGRLYKTGDLGRYLPDGNIQHLGRADGQIKLRGFRIELGEIEGLLSQNPIVHECAVILREDVPGNRRLVAYVVLSREAVTNDLELILHRYLRDNLPDYMVPTAIVFLERMPLTPTGKLDRRNFPVPKRSLPLLTSEIVLPQTETEKQISQVWQDILQLEAVSITQNFFEIGGNSLLLMQVYEKLAEIFENRLTTITKLFQYPTIQKLAAELSQDKAQQQVKKWIYQSNCYSMASYQRQIRQAHRHHQR
ncbi:MAG: amino acid adenylation domain-containing protein [Dolichospermum sp.]|jgi:amino acid adenylation domain-containing protein|nr:amino acid adenylation domain-containing protein [Dolichospermum sp.]